MKKKKKERSEYVQRLYRLIIATTLATVALVGGLFVGTYYDPANFQTGTVISLSIGLAFLGLETGYKSVFYRDKIHKYKYLIFGILYLVIAPCCAFALLNPVATYRGVGIAFVLIVIANRISIIIDNHTIRSIVLNALLLLLSALMLLYFILVVKTEVMTTLPLITALLAIIIAFVDIIRFLLVGMNKKVVVQIIIKTYAVEILYGLVILIVATSLLLSMTDDNFASFGDALWYCFATVTTIGFGDIVPASIIGRILTVLLGIYGIIVVALLTSIIVNLYNEFYPKDGEKGDKKEHPPVNSSIDIDGIEPPKDKQSLKQIVKEYEKGGKKEDSPKEK